MRNPPKKVFIGCALTHVPADIFPAYKKLIVAIEDLVLKVFSCNSCYAIEDSDPLLPKIPKDIMPSECYRLDRELVEMSDLVIAEASFPSTGLGQELQIAAYNKKPVILLTSNWDGRNVAEHKPYTTRSGESCSIEIGQKIVSVMVQGNPSIIKEIKYKDQDNCISLLEDFMRGYYTGI